MASVTMLFDFGIYLSEDELIELSDKISDYVSENWSEWFNELASDNEKRKEKPQKTLYITNTKYQSDKTTTKHKITKKEALEKIERICELWESINLAKNNIQYYEKEEIDEYKEEHNDLIEEITKEIK